VKITNDVPEPVPGPFTLTEREQEEVYQARLETNPELYPDSRTAILTGAIDRAVRTLGGSEWAETVVRPPSAPVTMAEANEVYGAAGLDHASSTAKNEHTRLALEAFLASRCAAPLVLAPAEPQPDAPTHIPSLPDYWDERRAKQQKPDKSRCAAELRIALAHTSAIRILADLPSATHYAAVAGIAQGTIERIEKVIGQAVRDDRVSPGFAAELLEIASTAGQPAASDKPDDAYRQGFSDGFARGVEYGRALAQLGKP
jgi:hypothetical protein